MSEHKILKWNDVLPAAKEAFDIWVGQPELRWTKKAWRHITNADLADYSDELERYIACMRFLALADIYHDWCAVAWDENSTSDVIVWASEKFDFEPFRLGQLIGPNELAEEFWSPLELTHSAMGLLITRERQRVVEALLRGYKTLTALFVGLYNSRATEKRDVLKLSEINSVDPQFSDAWAWLRDECPPWRMNSCKALINVDYSQPFF